MAMCDAIPSSSQTGSQCAPISCWEIYGVTCFSSPSTSCISTSNHVSEEETDVNRVCQVLHHKTRPGAGSWGTSKLL